MESKIASIIIGVIVFSMLIVGLSQGIEGFREHYKVNVDKNWEKVYDFSGNMSDLGKKVQDKLEDERTNWFTSGLSLGYSAVLDILTLPKYISQLLSNVAQALHLPTWIVNNITVIIIFIIFFIIVSALVRWYL